MDTTPKKNGNRLLISAICVLVIGFIFMILSPIIFTIHTESTRWNFVPTGPIGDTIGGLTAPIVGIINAILLFLALRAQVEGNTAAKNSFIEQREVEDVTHLYTNIKQSIDQFTYTPVTPNVNNTTEEPPSKDSCPPYARELKASEAIYELLNDFYCQMCSLTPEEIDANPKLTELISIIELLMYTLDRIERSNIPDKEALLMLTKHQFKYRINPRLSLEGTKLGKYFCKDCNQEHGFPERIATLIKELQQKSQ